MSQGIFRTADIALAVYLVLRGYRLSGIDHIGHNKGAFRFEGDPDGDGEILKFVNRKAKVEPNSFLEQVKSLKAMVSSR